MSQVEEIRNWYFWSGLFCADLKFSGDIGFTFYSGHYKWTKHPRSIVCRLAGQKINYDLDLRAQDSFFANRPLPQPT